MVYLMIVLQTCQHNPSVKNKTDLKSFLESARPICPKSIEEGLMTVEMLE